MELYLLVKNYNLGGYGPEIMHLRDPSCTAVENGTHYIFVTGYGKCGTTFAVSELPDSPHIGETCA